MKKFFQAPIKGYQTISRMLPGSCRYYPTCSEYAMWQFEFNAPHRALFSSTLRILRCNPLFEGGIDYPLIHFRPKQHPFLCSPNRFYGKIKIAYWVVPMGSDADDMSQSDLSSGSDSHPKRYYILKDLDDTYLTLPS